jgi:hypothetical protein
LAKKINELPVVGDVQVDWAKMKSLFGYTFTGYKTRSHAQVIFIQRFHGFNRFIGGIESTYFDV